MLEQDVRNKFTSIKKSTIVHYITVIAGSLNIIHSSFSVMTKFANKSLHMG